MPAVPPPTDLQIEQIVRTLARAHLEIERGLRDPDQLARLMPPATANAWLHAQSPTLRLPGGAVRGADLGSVHLQRTADGTVHARLITRTQPGRWGALILQLKLDRPRIILHRAQRLHAGRNYGQARPPRDDQLHHRLSRTLEEQRLVQSVLNATAQEPGRHTAQQATEIAAWRQLLAQLTVEITVLTRTEAHRQTALANQRR